jgi:hypothetical protein
MKRFGVIIVAVASLVAACSGARTDAAASSEVDRAAVEKTTAAFHEALRSNDLEPDQFIGSIAGLVKFARDSTGQITGFTMSRRLARGVQFDRRGAL